MKEQNQPDAEQHTAEEAQAMPPEAAAEPQPQVPPEQAGDVPAEVAVAIAQPVLQSVEEGRAALAADPRLTSVLTDQGHLVREP